ncbi:MAG: restriction endonuclease subunit S, partial [Lentisphaeria bacterium]
TAFQWCSKPARTARKGDILISVRAPVGEMNWADQDYCIGRGLAAVHPKNETPAFVWHALKENKHLLARVSQGSTFDAINREDLEQLLIPLPGSQEQRRIAKILNAVDDAIDATRTVIAQTRRLKSALLDDLLSNGLPGERKHRRAVKGVGEIPSDWQVFRLDDMSDGRRPPLRTGPFGSSLKTEHFVPSGRPVLTIGSLGEGEIVASELLFIDEAKATELREYEVLPGDVVFSRVADVGRSVTIPEHAAGWIISSNLMRITLDKRKFDPWFLRQSLVHNRLVTDQVRRLTADGGRQIVTSETLSGLLFPMPLRKEQDAIAEVIRRVDQRLRQDREIEVQLSQAKSALGQALLTGQVRVSLQEGKL